MRVIDSRRVRGPNLQTRGAAALVEVAFEAGEDGARAVASWRDEVARIGAVLAWSEAGGGARARVFRGGAVLTFPAPIDVLLAATEVNEWAVASATSIAAGGAPAEMEAEVERVRAEIETQQRP